MDSQLSDWDLKESICAHNNDSSYPFMAYHSSLTQSLYTIEEHMRTIKTELTRLHNRKEKLQKNTTNKHTHIIETLIRLELQGNQLEALLYQTQSMMIMLKNRIALLREYNDDYHNWIYERNKQRQEKA